VASEDPGPSLTPSQRAEAEALYRGLLVVWESGKRMALVTRHADHFSIGAIERRVDIFAVMSIMEPTV
jgi:hypothetical protein